MKTTNHRPTSFAASKLCLAFLTRTLLYLAVAAQSASQVRAEDLKMAVKHLPQRCAEL